MPPILLLKTRSSPHDGYEDLFSQHYDPTFVPVLEHRFHTGNLNKVRDLFVSGAFGDTTPNDQISGNGNSNSNETEHENRKYGGLIFTSQRAVEGFAKMIEDEKDGTDYTTHSFYSLHPSLESQYIEHILTPHSNPNSNLQHPHNSTPINPLHSRTSHSPQPNNPPQQTPPKRNDLRCRCGHG